MSRLKEKLESIVFAGLKPHTPGQAPPPETAWTRTRARLERWIAGGPVNDPLYLTNRTWGKKIRAWSLIAVPLLIVMGGLLVLITGVIEKKPQKEKELTSAEVAAKILPNVKDLRLDNNKQVDVVEARVLKEGGTHLVGALRNNTSHEIERAEISFDLTDDDGSQLGAISVTVDKIPAKGTKRFELPLKQPNSQYVLVREIATR